MKPRTVDDKKNGKQLTVVKNPEQIRKDKTIANIMMMLSQIDRPVAEMIYEYARPLDLMTTIRDFKHDLTIYITPKRSSISFFGLFSRPKPTNSQVSQLIRNLDEKDETLSIAKIAKLIGDAKITITPRLQQIISKYLTLLDEPANINHPHPPGGPCECGNELHTFPTAQDEKQQVRISLK